MLQFLSAPSNFEIRARYRLRLGHKTSGPMCALTYHTNPSHDVFENKPAHSDMQPGRNPRTRPPCLWPMHWVLRAKSRRRKSTNLFPTNLRPSSADPPRPPLGTFLTFITQFHSFRCRKESDSSDVVKSLSCCPVIPNFKDLNQTFDLNTWCTGWCRMSLKVCCWTLLRCHCKSHNRELARPRRVCGSISASGRRRGRAVGWLAGRLSHPFILSSSTATRHQTDRSRFPLLYLSSPKLECAPPCRP